MSKYTTEVRFICENACGYTESKGADLVDTIVSKSWNKIFTNKFPIYDEKYRPILCQKILKHYYLREIGCETVGIWKMWLNERMEMIMPLYNQLYKSALIEFNPLYDVELTRDRVLKGTGTKDTENSENRSGTNSTHNSQTTENTHDVNVTDDVTRNNKFDGTVNGTQKQNTTGNGTNMYSDTPQGSIKDLQDGKYLTNATVDNTKNTFSGESNDTTKQTTNETTKNNRIDRGNNESEVNGNSNSDYSSGMSGSSNTTMSNTEEYIEHVMGSNGGESFSKRLNAYRETFINIDMMIINELEDLFFGLW